MSGVRVVFKVPLGDHSPFRNEPGCHFAREPVGQDFPNARGEGSFIQENTVVSAPPSALSLDDRGLLQVNAPVIGFLYAGRHVVVIKPQSKLGNKKRRIRRWYEEGELGRFEGRTSP